MSAYSDLRASIRPISTWPGEQTRSRRHAPFRAGWTDTVELLQKELRQLGAKDVVLEMGIDEQYFRRDGLPRVDARARHPGVILSFTSKFGPLRYPCDTFHDWRDNVRAIALAMEALRTVDRYGVTRRGEQYTGWRALPPSGGSTPTMTAWQAAGFVIRAAEAGLNTKPSDLLRDRQLAGDLYRIAAKKLHPDVGGTAEGFAALGVARGVLELHHGGAAK